jgi:hypothetical protein
MTSSWRENIAPKGRPKNADGSGTPDACPKTAQTATKKATTTRMDLPDRPFGAAEGLQTARNPKVIRAGDGEGTHRARGRRRRKRRG